MKNSTLCVFFLACLSFNATVSQEINSRAVSIDTLSVNKTSSTAFNSKGLSPEQLQMTSRDSIVESAWMFSVGYNFVDDSGDMVDELFSFEDQWNAVAFPSRVSLGRYFKSGVGVEGIATYNKYKVGKLIDGITNLEETDYFALDARLSYDLNKIIGETAWFDPYVGIGLGYTSANDQARGTYNAVIGFRTWFSDHWGLDLNSSGKWAVNTENASNHLQHAAGVVYRFDIEKRLSKKGEEKLALIEAFQAEEQRKQDSIAAVNREKEAAALAERLAQEKEAAQLAAAEKAKEEAENQRKRNIENEIEALGFVYFDLNSSYLGKRSRSILDEITKLLIEYDSVVLKVSSFTDSRGTSTYNDWLSRRRVERTVGYLIEQGIDAERLIPEGFGEENLLNECDDNTYCPEEKHKINRRSEFKVVEF